MSGFSDSWFTSLASGTELWHFSLNMLSIKWNRLVWPNVVRCSTEIILNSALTCMYINPDDPKGKLNLCMYQRAEFTPVLTITRNFNYISGTWWILNWFLNKSKHFTGFSTQPSQLERMCKLYLLPTPSACALRLAFA